VVVLIWNQKLFTTSTPSVGHFAVSEQVHRASKRSITIPQHWLEHFWRCGLSVPVQRLDRGTGITVVVTIGNRVLRVTFIEDVLLKVLVLHVYQFIRCCRRAFVLTALILVQPALVVTTASSLSVPMMRATAEDFCSPLYGSVWVRRRTHSKHSCTSEHIAER